MSKALPKDSGLQRTGHYPLVRADVLYAKHELRLTMRILDRCATRHDESDYFLEPTLDLGAHSRLKHDTGIEQENLHRHVYAAPLLLLLPLHGRRVWSWLIWLGVRNIWLAQERLRERVECQVGADPARREGMSQVEREVGAWVRRVEQLRNRLSFVFGDKDQAGARRRVAELLGASGQTFCGSKQKTLDGKRTLTDLRGVGGFGSILSSKHFGRTPHGMAYSLESTRKRNRQALGASVGIINLFGKVYEKGRR
jgi:hypothetical protein